MSGRSYLSIGDVLSLLREEFPDVTISKIRFLESQGLVDPERSPSGYRKFYDDDVARLRWVLRKQRDQFLPLKVIRDRLAAAGTGVPPDTEPADGAGLAADAGALADATARADGAAPADGAEVADGVVTGG
ncbi:MAG: MerR family transcriptional regulator, partial [Actinomycetota bacterium]|nr:MerR family transcriptional regulator [Actinomycetota bacterium]